MKKIIPILSGTIAALLTGVLIAHAETPSDPSLYVPLAPLPIGPEGSTILAYNMSTYLGGAIKLLIALGAGLAVLMAIVGGVQRVASGISPAAKQGANERITNAFIGLGLILTSYLILNSINPDLVNFKLDLPAVGTSLNNSYLDATSTPSGGVSGPWPDDSVERQKLSSGGVTVRDTCRGRTDRPKPAGCTSVAQLPLNAIESLIALKSACGSCNVIVTGGTEWGHQTHGLGKSIVDLSHQGPALNNYITGHSGPPTTGGGCGVRSAYHYRVTGPGAGTYVSEGVPPATDGSSPHWHVCY